jgi:hypothetical protein
MRRNAKVIMLCLLVGGSIPAVLTAINRDEQTVPDGASIPQGESTAPPPGPAARPADPVAAITELSMWTREQNMELLMPLLSPEWMKSLGGEDGLKKALPDWKKMFEENFFDGPVVNENRATFGAVSKQEDGSRILRELVFEKRAEGWYWIDLTVQNQESP